MTKRPSHVLHRTGGRCLHCDERGVFPVVEAILVAVLVLTAILFFTSVQRPTTGAEEGGIDLAQVAADSLQLMQSSTSITNPAQTFEGWVTNLTRGDQATAQAVDEYLVGTNGDGILPKGARYQLRLDNGVSSIPLLPTGGADAPRGARAAQVTLLPNWATYGAARASWIMFPGEVATATSPWLDLVDDDSTTTIDCVKDPIGSTTLVDLDGDDNADGWIDPATGTPDTTSHWRAAPSATVTWKATQWQVPRDALLGTWQAYNNADCTSSSGYPVYFQVVPPGDGARRVSAASVVLNGTDITSATAAFTADDVGRIVGMTGVPAGTRILSVTSATQATLTAVATSTQTNQPATFGYKSPYFPYSLQLVVWFGA